MTMQGTELIGARVADADGKVVGNVDKVYHDDVDRKPVWALVRTGKLSRFVPIRGSRMTADGFSVPFGTLKIMTSPEMHVDQHMSPEQVAELHLYYGLAVPAQARQPTGQPTGAARAGQPAGRSDVSSSAGEAWLVRSEERMDVGTEVLETHRVRLRKYVDVEPVEQAVHVFHEEFEVERIPIAPQERTSGPVAEADQELILHEERAVFKKETVAVERVRLVARRIEEDRTFRDEIRKERIEVVADGDSGMPRAGQLPEQDQRRPLPGRHRGLARSARAG